MNAVLIGINSKYIHTALGLRYVGEYAKSQGHNITLIEETINSQPLAVLEKIMDHKAEVYAFSVHIWNKPFVFKIIRMLKKLRPESSIVLGGPEVAFDVEKIFAIPGLGQHLTQAIINRDYTMIMGVTIFYAMVLTVCVLVVDILYVFID